MPDDLIDRAKEVREETARKIEQARDLRVTVSSARRAAEAATERARAAEAGHDPEETSDA